MAETADSAVLAAGAETQNAQSLGNDNALLLVVGRGDTLEDLEALHGGGTTGGLVGNHAADSLVEDAGRSAEVEGTTTGGVETSHLAKVGVVLDCRTKGEVSIPLYDFNVPIVGFPIWRSHYANLRIPFSCIQYSQLQPYSRRQREKKKRSNRKRCERTLRAEELAGDVKSLASHNDDLLAVEQLLGDGTGQATQKVPLAVDGDLFQRHSVSDLSF